MLSFLIATEPTDHSIENDLMHVIWAQGQEPGRYHHSPKSGLEREYASVPDFYRADELKYHGHGTQRGKTTLNFFGKSKLLLELEYYLVCVCRHVNICNIFRISWSRF